MKEAEKRAVSIFKALSCPTRYKIIKLLSKRAVCTGEIGTLIGKSPTTVSKHLKILRDLDILYYITEDRNVLNSLKKREILEIIEHVEEILSRN
ncbi:winged helix-turn-helix transcriptional regulator [Candidatus Calescamantes bacterium]|nr:winged helix-turn-helix transcriptional regulator [Candidatus Calescamantes bacterium]MCK5600045.1 winged helix-turn-helix transcriptional regulator [bacterium]